MILHVCGENAHVAPKSATLWVRNQFIFTLTKVHQLFSKKLSTQKDFKSLLYVPQNPFSPALLDSLNFLCHPPTFCLPLWGKRVFIVSLVKAPVFTEACEEDLAAPFLNIFFIFFLSWFHSVSIVTLAQSTLTGEGGCCFRQYIWRPGQWISEAVPRK